MLRVLLPLVLRGASVEEGALQGGNGQADTCEHVCVHECVFECVCVCMCVCVCV